MEKSYLKHVLVLLDHDEIRGIDFDQAVNDVFQELHRESSRVPAREQVRLDIQEIIDASLMKRLTRGYDHAERDHLRPFRHAFSAGGPFSARLNAQRPER